MCVPPRGERNVDERRRFYLLHDEVLPGDSSRDMEVQDKECKLFLQDKKIEKQIEGKSVSEIFTALSCYFSFM